MNKNKKDTRGIVYMGIEDVKGLRTIKIGFTSRSIARRMMDYDCYSTTFRVIDEMTGTMETEKDFQIRLEEDFGFEPIQGKFSNRTEFFRIPKSFSLQKLKREGFKIFNTIWRFFPFCAKPTAQ